MSTIAHACETVGELRGALAGIPDEVALVGMNPTDDAPLRVEIFFLERPDPENIREVRVGDWPEE
jgi:hypothetical protein